MTEEVEKEVRVTPQVCIDATFSWAVAHDQSEIYVDSLQDTLDLAAEVATPGYIAKLPRLSYVLRPMLRGNGNFVRRLTTSWPARSVRWTSAWQSDGVGAKTRRALRLADVVRAADWHRCRVWRAVGRGSGQFSEPSVSKAHVGDERTTHRRCRSTLGNSRNSVDVSTCDDPTS